MSYHRTCLLFCTQNKEVKSKKIQPCSQTSLVCLLIKPCLPPNKALFAVELSLVFYKDYCCFVGGPSKLRNIVLAQKKTEERTPVLHLFCFLLCPLQKKC